MHKIDWIRVNNFRSCADVSLKLEKFSPLVGYNNAGKSNLLKAIKWFLRPSGLAEKDFNDANSQVSVTARVSGISEGLLSTLDESHSASIAPYIEEESMYVRLIQKSPGGAKALRKLYVSKGGDGDEDEWEWKLNPSGLQEALHDLFPEPIFIQSMDNATDDVSKFKTSSTIGKLLQLLSSKIEKDQHELIDALDIISRKLNFDGGERLEALDEFDQLATERVQDFFPGVSIKVHIPTPSLSKLFTDGTIKVQEVGRDSADVDSLGHGAQRSIQMALIRLLAEKQTETDSGQTTLLLIDEPELYLHPQATELVRDALKVLSNHGYQIVFTTHSGLMVEQEDVPNTSIVRKNENQETVVSERIADAIKVVIDGNANQARILFEVYNMSQILFADRVLIAEGATELSVLPDLFKACGRPFNVHKTALVIADGCSGIHKMGRILKRIGIPYKALVDLDYVFTTAKSAKLLQEDDAHLAAALPLLSASAAQNGFELDGGVLPKRTGNLRAYEAYELFADEEGASDLILALHEQLKEQNYWLWTKGAIEKHLSLEAKSTGNWIDFKLRLKNGNVEESLEDYPFVNQMVAWATS
ncbi:ATP-dependent endonuclease [Vibrio alginolyticus]|nr:ATP-dependent endonuclease [Vibrio alginolyticus]